MDVLVGPTFTIDVSPPAAGAAAKTTYSLPPESPPLLLKHRVSSVVEEEEEEEEDGVELVRPISISGSGNSLDDSDSSVGAPDDDDDSEEEEEEEGESNSASSSTKKVLGSLGSMNALEDSLPTKKGLSNYFAGKSKSFASLSDASLSASGAKDLEKPEHPFNKRRRILMANKWSRRSSFYSWRNPNSMPLLALNEDDDDNRGDDHRQEEEEEEGEGDEDRRESLSSSSSSDKDEEGEEKRRGQRKFGSSFKCHSCFSLTDLQEQRRRQEGISLPPRR